MAARPHIRLDWGVRRNECCVCYQSVSAFRGNAETLQLIVFTQVRTQNRCALLLELLWEDCS